MSRRLRVALGGFAGLFLALAGVVLARAPAPPDLSLEPGPVDNPTNEDIARGPGPTTPAELEAAQLTLLYWVQQFGDQMRWINGAAANPLRNTYGGSPPLGDRAAFDREFTSLASRERACAIRDQLELVCGSRASPPVAAGVRLQARDLSKSVYALCNDFGRRDGLAPASDPPCGRLLALARERCAALGGVPP